MKSKWKWIAVIGLSILAAIIFAGAVAAQGPTDEPGHPAGRGGVQLELLADALGMTPDELKAALQAGNTIEDIAAGQGVTMAAIARSFYDHAVERLNSAVSEGKIDQARADMLISKLDERYEACVNEGECTLHPAPKRQRRHMARQMGMALQTIAHTLDMPVPDMLQALMSGGGLADIAAERGVSMTTIADALFGRAAQHVERALAEGKIDQARAGQILSELEARREACATEGQCLFLPAANR